MSKWTRRLSWTRHALDRDIARGRLALIDVSLSLVPGEFPMFTHTFVRVMRTKRRRFNGPTRKQRVCKLENAAAAWPDAIWMVKERT